VADGINLEKRGIPAVSILTTSFTRSGDAMARRYGFPGYRYAMVQHPLGGVSPEECKQKAREVLEDVIAILASEKASVAPTVS
jgi:hypothetical protein